MKKSDVELVLEKSYKFWSEKLKEGVNLLDIYVLADEIWGDIMFETDVKEEIIEFAITKSQLLNLEKWGEIALILEDNKQVCIYFIDDTELTAITESGKVIISGKKWKYDS